jgi:hypothetical protein
MDPQDLGELKGALNDAAGKASALWTTFVTLEIYLLIAIGSVTHRDLFLETPIKLPLLNVDLPLTGFFVIAPIILLIVHFYVFIQLLALAQKARFFDAELVQQVPLRADRQLIRHRLDTFIILQFLCGPKDQREGPSGLSLRLIAWLTLVAAPVLIILFAQLTFLPYHGAAVLWSLRVVLMLDIGLIWLFWNRIRSSDDALIPIISTAFWVNLGTILSILIVTFTVTEVTYPGEVLVGSLPKLSIIPSSIGWRSPHEILFAGLPDEVRGRSTSFFSDRLVLPDQSFVDAEKIDKLTVSHSFRGRDLTQAVFDRADLRKADFERGPLSMVPAL